MTAGALSPDALRAAQAQYGLASPGGPSPGTVAQPGLTTQAAPGSAASVQNMPPPPAQGGAGMPPGVGQGAPGANPANQTTPPSQIGAAATALGKGLARPMQGPAQQYQVPPPPPPPHVAYQQGYQATMAQSPLYKMLQQNGGTP